MHCQGWIGPGTTWVNEMNLGWNIAPEAFNRNEFYCRDDVQNLKEIELTYTIIDVLLNLFIVEGFIKSFEDTSCHLLVVLLMIPVMHGTCSNVFRNIDLCRGRVEVVHTCNDENLTLKSASHDNWCTVGMDGTCRVGKVRAGTTPPMPDHKGFKLQ